MGQRQGMEVELDTLKTSRFAVGSSRAMTEHLSQNTSERAIRIKIDASILKTPV